jgi:hypothetical protein
MSGDSWSLAVGTTELEAGRRTWGRGYRQYRSQIRSDSMKIPSILGSLAFEEKWKYIDPARVDLAPLRLSGIQTARKTRGDG